MGPWSSSQSRPPLRRIAAAVVVVLALSLTACTGGGGASSGASNAVTAATQTSAPAAHAQDAVTEIPVPNAARQNLCLAIPFLTQLTVPLPGGTKPWITPGKVGQVGHTLTVTGQATVRALAQTLCALPLLSRMHFCFATLGRWFLLDFHAASSFDWQVWITNGGCEEVIGAGPQHRAAETVAFFHQLARALNQATGVAGRGYLFGS